MQDSKTCQDGFVSTTYLPGSYRPVNQRPQCASDFCTRESSVVNRLCPQHLVMTYPKKKR